MLLLAFPAFSQTAPLVQHSAPKPLPALEYLDAKGAKKPLDTKFGNLIIVHLWATWCVPCVKELPELEKFATGNDTVTVYTLSLDKPDSGKVEEFYAKHGIKTLPIMYDDKMTTFRALEVRALPSSIFILNDKEVARIGGPADWQGDEVKGFLKAE